VRGLGRLLGQEKSGEAMDARAAPFDANKIRAHIAKYLGIDAERVTDETHFRNEIEVVGDLIRYMEINSLPGDLYTHTFRRSAA
jgi:hypothetical protein